MKLSPEQAAGMRDGILQELAVEHKTTMTLLEACPEGKLGWSPHEKSMPFGEHFYHLYTGGSWLFAVAAGQEPPSGKTETPSGKDALREACLALYKKNVEGWKGLSPEDLATQREFMGMGSFPAAAYLRWDVSHLIHHRGQLQLYLRLMGAECPSIYGPTADVSSEEVAAASKKDC